MDHLTKCGRKEEQLQILLVILPVDKYSYSMELIAVSDLLFLCSFFYSRVWCFADKVEEVCMKLGVTFYYCYAGEAWYASKGHLKRIAYAI